MNPLLKSLQPYPFERLRKLFAGAKPSDQYRPISLGIGEPKHPTPAVITEALSQAYVGLSQYPATAGLPILRQACTNWVQKRYNLLLDPETQVLPILGSREALFSIAQAVLDPADTDAYVACPNPFYQIYEGAALLAGAKPLYVASNPARNFAVDWNTLSEADWSRVRMMFVCSPGNPTGAVMGLDEWEWLFRKSDQHGFVIVSDECYSEIYFGDQPPLGGLEAAQKLGRTDFKRLISLTSLSKRSNAPGLRSGFAAGDADILRAFLQYRTYHGSAMSTTIQMASIAAWNDEAHVIDNRRQYSEKFAAVLPLLSPHLQVSLPDAGFYLWPEVHPAYQQDDEAFARDLYSQYNVTVLPGSYLARETQGFNPGRGRVRLALVASVDECIEATQRIADFCSNLK
jgi:N-succinyldiaminopimelate aminotransferase